MLNFLQLAGTPTSEEWEEVHDEVEEESEDEGYEPEAGDSDDEEEEEQELQEAEFAAALGESVDALHLISFFCILSRSCVAGLSAQRTRLLRLS
jgi:hypothetical protein